MITLYEFALSGNCHKVRLLLSLLGLDYQSIAINGGERQHKAEAFIEKNPFGQVPVLTDGEVTIRDSLAILVYLARQYGDEHWLPNQAAALAEVTEWLATAANEVALGPNRLRLHYKFGRPIDLDDAERITSNLLSILQARLKQHDWLAGAQASIADIAVYPYIALAPEGKIDLAPYPALIAWMHRIQALPAYVGMPGMWTAK
ncbi:MAG: glutathione S-transferase N-terminal domain-containing protein [Methylobacter sp.]|uniref:Glutathione S-transferase N-terminal domain-containing protein n=1 Tax=Candidatus Methylobacter titanis TaxID=3053457 RepID=A0AA43Q4V4_9GAMM|nr:glutathione S-transferase N-terminal domain-containing protein [Candidatus Methylobacter titanis]